MLSEVTFDVMNRDGHYLSEARGLSLSARGTSFEEMMNVAIGLLKSHFTSTEPRPKSIRVIFEEVIAV